MEGYRSEEQSALQKRAVKRICDKSNRFHKRVIKNPAGICDKKERCQLSREPESRQNGSTRGFDLISDVFSFGRLCYGEPDAPSSAIGYAKFFSRSHHAVIRACDEVGNVIETQEQTAEFKKS
jgi:hypothetical protein